MNWALFLALQGWKCLRKARGTSGDLVPGTTVELDCKDKTPRRVHSTDMTSVNFSLWLLLFPAPKTKAVIGTWRLEDDSELTLPGKHSWKLLSLWERCGWG